MTMTEVGVLLEEKQGLPQFLQMAESVKELARVPDLEEAGPVEMFKHDHEHLIRERPPDTNGPSRIVPLEQVMVA
jgi:hypothetical protein